MSNKIECSFVIPQYNSNAMKVNLPPRRDGKPSEFIDLADASSFIIIGANGAGKTRFTSSIVHSLGEKAFTLSALDALYNRRSDNGESPSSLRSHFSPMVVSQVEKGNTMPTILELLLAQLMHDEMINLIGYKLARASGGNAELGSTHLDSVINLWQDVFPGNKMLIDSGKILFTRGIDMNTYSALRLSDGERAVLYYAGAIQYAPKGAVIFVDTPEVFLHPSLVASLWNRLEALRSDCTFCYTTHDPEFASSRNGAPVVWVRDCDPEHGSWDYDIMPAQSEFAPEIYMTLVGARKPVLFIEGDSQRSIDAKLYPLIFPDYTVRSLGSCNKVIESTRTFNDLASFHKMDSMGIVDRDRRDDTEVAYLRRKRIMVPDVAEIENLLLIEDIIRTMASINGKDPNRVFLKVRKTILALFKGDLKQQALLHTRHRVKRIVEYRVDARCASIDTLEDHLTSLVEEINAERIYNDFCRKFHEYVREGNYEAVLRVFNQKSMLSSCNVAQLCGYNNKDSYIRGIISALRKATPEATIIRNAVKKCLGADFQSVS